MGRNISREPEKCASDGTETASITGKHNGDQNKDVQSYIWKVSWDILLTRSIVVDYR